MEERLLNHATFTKVCRMLKKRESLWNGVKPLLNGLLEVIPALVSTEFTMASLFENGTFVTDAVESVAKSVEVISKLVRRQDGNVEDYITRTENVQIANVLLVLTAYFDTVKSMIPDDNNSIRIDGVQYQLAAEGIESYKKRLLDKGKEPIEIDGSRIANWELVLPNKLQGFELYKSNLRDFYVCLNKSFGDYLDSLSCIEEIPEHFRDRLNGILRVLPETAVLAYDRQYQILSMDCPDFFVWSTQQEHGLLSKQIDMGFDRLSEQIQCIPEALHEYAARESLMALQNFYSSFIQKPLIPIEDMPPEDKEMRLPTKEEIFIPQLYEWLIYKDTILVEMSQQWEDGEDIGLDILHILRHPEMGAKPILILGDPGAGKTTLCHMLAGKLLYKEYHVVILQLRNLDANLPIVDQINQQIKLITEDDGCKWGDISKTKLSKPILLIFDGYDELIQASGNSHRNYLKDILEFQERQWNMRQIVVRSIVTSRTILIDKVDIPRESTVLRLKPFDEMRICWWCKIWNQANKQYFQSKGLLDFSVKKNSEAAKLAGEPLLLLMLALYDTNGNALHKHQNLQATELYFSLIWDFVTREKKKDTGFCNQQLNNQNEAIEKEIERIGVAALGMFNRNEFHITSGQLEKDLQLLAFLNSSQEIKDSERLLGSFFFIHKDMAAKFVLGKKEALRAYTFLHNTFGEFLTAYYIVLQLYKLLSSLKNKTTTDGVNTLSLRDQCSWYACLSYAPLFRRPIVGKMLREWAPRFFRRMNFSFECATNILNDLFRREIEMILHGEKIITLKSIENNFTIASSDKTRKRTLDLMEHAAIYANNLLSLTTLLSGKASFLEIEKEMPEAWNKLLHLWRYTFDENEIAMFAGQYEFHQKERALVAAENVSSSQDENNRVKKMYHSYKALHEEPEASILGSLLGVDTEEICSALRRQDLHIEAKCILGGVSIKNSLHYKTLFFSTKDIRSLHDFFHLCLEEQDYASMYNMMIVLNDMASTENGARQLSTRFPFFPIEQIYYVGMRFFPALIASFLELLIKMVPRMPDEQVKKIVLELDSTEPFDKKLTEREILLWAHLLQLLLPRREVNSSFPNIYFRVELLLKKVNEWQTMNPDVYSGRVIEILSDFCLKEDEKTYDISLPTGVVYNYLGRIQTKYSNSEISFPLHCLLTDLSVSAKTFVYTMKQARCVEIERKDSVAERKQEVLEAKLTVARDTLFLLLRHMHNDRCSLVDCFCSNSIVLSAICFCITELPHEICEYVLLEIIKYIERMKDNMPLGLFRELNVVAECLKHNTLKETLEQIK